MSACLNTVIKGLIKARGQLIVEIMFAAPYINQTEYKALKSTKPSVQHFERLKAAALAGNIQAAFHIGDTLLIGGWNVKRMELDIARGKLKPATADPRKDPYLCVHRDQYLAVRYLKFCAEYPCETAAKEISCARAFLAFIQKTHDIQYTGKGSRDAFFDLGLTRINKIATVEEKKRDPFIHFAFARPDVKNPKTGMFANVAVAAFKRSLQLIFTILFNTFLSSFILWVMNDDYIDPIMVLFVFSFAVLILPLLIFSFLYKVIGIDRFLPVCSCSQIREARETALAQLPEDCKVDEQDPFKNTFFILRNIHHLKQVFFGVYLIGTLVFLGLVVADKVDFYGTLYFIPSEIINTVIVSMIIYPALILIQDRKIFDDFSDFDCANERELIGPAGVNV